MEVIYKKKEIYIYQRKYAKEILKENRLEKCKTMNTPMNQKEKFIKEDGADKVSSFQKLDWMSTLYYILFPVSFCQYLCNVLVSYTWKQQRVVRYIEAYLALSNSD